MQNVFAVVMCGGQHEEAPPHMADEFQRHRGQCEVGWCLSRKVDCHGLSILVVAWLSLFVYSLWWLVRTRRRALRAIAKQKNPQALYQPPQRRPCTWRCCGRKQAEAQDAEVAGSPQSAAGASAHDGVVAVSSSPCMPNRPEGQRPQSIELGRKSPSGSSASSPPSSPVSARRALPRPHSRPSRHRIGTPVGGMARPDVPESPLPSPPVSCRRAHRRSPVSAGQGYQPLLE